MKKSVSSRNLFCLGVSERVKMSYHRKGIPLHSISPGNSSTEYDTSESSDDDVGGPPPMLPRRGKTYSKLVSDNSDLIKKKKKKPPMPRRGNTYANLVGRKGSLLKSGRVRSAVIQSPRRRDDSIPKPTHQRKSTGSMVSDNMLKPPPLPPRQSSRDSPLKREQTDDLPIVWVNLNPSPGLKVEFPTGKWKVTVPPGRTGGQRLRITLSEDTDVRVLIPQGLKTGDRFLVRHNSVAQFDTFASSQLGSFNTADSSRSFSSTSSDKNRSIAPLKLTSSNSFEDKLKQRFDRIRGLHISVTTWNVENTSPSMNAISAVLKETHPEAEISVLCVQMCPDVSYMYRTLRGIINVDKKNGQFEVTNCVPVGPDANGLFTVMFVFMTKRLTGLDFKATIRVRTVRQGSAMMFQKVRGSIRSDAVDTAPSAVLVRLRLVCMADEVDHITPRGAGRQGNFVDLKFVTFYLPEDTMLKFRLNARNKILCDFLSQLRDCDDSPNRAMICAGAFNYRLVLDPSKTLTTLRQIAGHNNRDSPRAGSPSSAREATKVFWEYLYPFDELQRLLAESRSGGGEDVEIMLRGFQEKLPAFIPSFPRVTLDSVTESMSEKLTENLNIDKYFCTDKHEQITPSWTDRIIWKDEITEKGSIKFSCLDDYRALNIVEHSRHCPVTATFKFS